MIICDICAGRHPPIPGLRRVRPVRVIDLPRVPNPEQSCADPPSPSFALLSTSPPAPVHAGTLSPRRLYECQSAQPGGFGRECFGWDQGRVDCHSHLRVRGFGNKTAPAYVTHSFVPHRRQLSSHPTCGMAVLEVSTPAKPNKVGS